MSNKILSILTILLIICLSPLNLYAEDTGTADVGYQSTPVPSAMQFTGAATYSIPISVLPGRNNLAPNLSLSYNSFSGNGWLGLGWNLGMPAIQRATKRGLDYSAHEFLAGSDELVPWSEWGTGYYRAKIESGFSKYYFDETANTWTVTAKNGSIFFYGASLNSRLGKDDNNTFIWMLERVEDTNGNYFIVNYTTDQGQVYLDSIEYTGHDYNNGFPDLAPPNKVFFELEDRPDPLVSYSIGKKITTAKRLKAINIYNKDDDLCSSYNLIYQTDAPVNLSRLDKVQKIGSDGSTMPPVELEWNAGGLINFDSYQATTTPGATASGYMRFADLNGDGKDDLIKHDTTGTVYTALGRGDGIFETFNTIEGPGGQGAGYISLGDINADGKVDLIKSDSGGAVYYAFSLGDGTFENFSTHNGPGGNGEWQVAVADLNGDGAGDLIKSTKNYTEPTPPASGQGISGMVLAIVDQFAEKVANETTYVYLFDKDTNSFSDTYTQVDGLHGGVGREFLIDIDHDSYPDLIRKDNNNTLHMFLFNGTDGFDTTPTTTFTAPDIKVGYTKFGDVNADGLTDLITFRTDGTVSVYLNNGNGSFFNSPITHSGPGGNGHNLVQVRDVNNDGYADLIKEDLSCTVYIYLGKGDGSFETTNFSQSKPGSDIRLGVMFNDINGDGVLDLVRSADNGVIYSYPAQGFGTPSLLKSAKTQNAASISMNYTPSTAFTHTLMPNKMFLVTARTINDGLGNLSTENYEYYNGLYDFEEKEFRGFGYVKKVNPDGTINKTFFHQDEFFKGMAYETQFLEPDEETLLTKTTNTYESVPLDNSDDPVVFVRLAQTRSETYDDDTTFTQKNIEYDDDSGNPVRTILSGTGAESLVTDMLYEVYGDWMWRKTRETLSGEDALTSSGAGKVREQYFTYNPNNGNLLSESAWLEGSTNPSVSYGYDSYGNQISVTNARGYTSTIEYDIETQTFPVRASKPDTSGPGGEYQISHTVSTTYNYLYAKPASVTDENNRTTYYTYDGFGRSIQTDLPDGGQTQTQYYDDTIPRYTVSKVKETEAAGLVTVGYAFKDGLGRPIQSVTRGKDQYIVSRKYYDTMGRAYKTKGPFFSYDGNWPQEPPETCPWSEAEFDYFGRPTSIKSPGVNGSESAISVLMYSGLKTTAIDPDNSRKEEIKDYLGRVKEVIQYSNTETIHTYYEYNAAKDLLKTTNHFGKQTHLQYDTLGRKIAMQDPDMGDWSYTYDDNGNLLTQTDAKLKITQFTYDELDRPLKKEILNPGPTGDEPVFYEYDNPNIPNGIGRLYTVTKADTQTVYATYDVMGRDREITKIIGDQSYTTSKEYDLSGKMTKLTYPDGYFVTYQYHPGTGLLHNTIGSDNTTQAWFEDYEPTGKIGAIDYGNGAFTTYTYDEATTRLTSIKAFDADAVKLMDKNYTYSKAGDITQIQDDYNNVTHQYTYDALHRLESEQSSNQGGFVAGESVSVMDYQYQQKESDPYHGVSSITHNGQEITYQYDANGNMITSPDIQDLNYTNRLITYNSDNMPVQIIKGGTTVNFTYDGHGTRIAKTVNNGSTTYYIGSHYEIRNGIATKYLFAGNLRIAMIKNNAAVYFHKDHLGSSTVLTDDTGTITNNQQTTYMPYGSISGSSDITDTSYKFTDQEYDGETGLYNYNARLYDPVIGMFISADTIVPDPLNPQTFNRYSYCYNNPLMYVDPSGHWGFNPFKWVGDAVSWLMDDVLGIETLNFGIFAGVGFEVGFDFRDGVSITNFGVGIGEGGYLSIGGWDIDAGASWGAGSYSTVGYDRNMGFYYSESYGFSGGSFSGTYYFGSGNYSVNAGFGYGPASTSVGYSSLGSFSNTVGLMGVSYNTQTGRFGVNVDGNDIQATYENGVNNRTKNGYGAENGNKTFNFIIDYLGTSTAGWEAAEGHDLGYGELGRNKNSIDSTFFTDMVKGSLARLNFQKNGFIKAGIGLFISGPYYAAVGFGGGSAYNAAQQNAYDAALKEIY